MTTFSAIRNTRTGDTAWPSSGLSGDSRRWRCGLFDFSGRLKVLLRSLPASLRLTPHLTGGLDDFESRNRLNWWSYGAFARKGQLEGNQYLAGRRAPPLLHR